MSKRNYNVCVTETLSTIVTIEAESPDEALDLAERQYDEEKIVLDAEHYCGTEFEITDQEADE